jgi:rubredoxin
MISISDGSVCQHCGHAFSSEELATQCAEVARAATPWLCHLLGHKWDLVGSEHGYDICLRCARESYESTWGERMRIRWQDFKRRSRDFFVCTIPKWWRCPECGLHCGRHKGEHIPF